MSSDLFQELTAPNGVKYEQPLGLFINNEFVAARSGKKITTVNPANEEDIAHVHAAGVEDVDIAVKAAKAAFKGQWSTTNGTTRGALLHKMADLVEQHRRTLATIETWDNGKPYTAAFGGDVGEVISVFRYYAGWADKVTGDVIETTPGKMAYTIAEPVGVCAQIVPWNYPLGMASWKLAPALAAGCTIVMKASEQTPLSILYLATLFKQAGFPAGVVNIINGYGAEAGAAMASHLDVDKIASTGSTATGQQIMKAAASNLKNVVLETGGKTPLIIFEDANLETAVKWGHYGIMANAGQICTANSRILVHESIYDTYVDMFKQKIQSTSKLGDPFAEDTFQGPQVTKQQFDRILSYVEIGKQGGATLELGGKPWKDADGKGFYIEPTIFTNVSKDMRIYREEIFGPFVVIASFSTDDEAVAMANDSDYGLSAAFFTKDVSRAHRVAKRLEAGTVWINSSNDTDYRVPFGGVKQSGIGRECGEAGIKSYTSVKSVYLTLE
ncbi:aldehyde dehydrogenase domain-containing protein [Boeremia exigua]|uniref:aldehyde dehydrogenase domain-containing protein n=1 Tax=Boeremia exigua TaxID=749465 RepID=UPI001E8E2FBD|nr:aldehyde dehydrogenase domain-containing protein [Boeremia exigua]KAH6628978.1 aldehyde dehydrogenase domain-containing protein [Boeremia exigua]